ncbi:hypothetical protein ABZR88_08605 [Mucilaginibacter yixingensis]|uniref:hypothetical protein n=1 Tax=Mucilaginibacter yixingensis TaxID=1295612 RepID=UPI0011B1FE9D|nr:hypothetical protein [Mucilaginibacter yixingensis]
MLTDSSGAYGQRFLKVIQHYQRSGEQTKLQAAYVILANLKGQTHTTGPGVVGYQSLFHQLLTVPEAHKKDYETIWDSLTNAAPDIHLSDVAEREDFKTITPDYLIAHIDAAFRAWQMPWAKSLSFNDFCAYILPYKLVDELPSSWMQTVQKRYHWLADSMKGSTDAYKACLLLNNDLKNNFTIRSFPSMWDSGFPELDAIRSGKCYQATEYTTFVMRAMGIPVVMDGTPTWGNASGGHDWNALIDHGKPVPFVGSESDPGLTKIELAFQRKRPKVFRHTFDLQPQALASLQEREDLEEPIPLEFHNQRLKDVTKEYLPVTDIAVNLKKNGLDRKIAYLCVYSRQDWVPVYWARIADQNRATFSDMGRDILYLPAYNGDQGRMVGAGNPVYADTSGKVQTLNPNPAKQIDITVSKKGPDGPNIEKGKTYELCYWQEHWVFAGKETASGKTVCFKHVPSNAVYWVSNPDKATKERIFTYTNHTLSWH